MLYPVRPRAAGARRAVAAAELAVLLPFLCFLFVITVDFARIFYALLTVANCARNGAVYASNCANAPGWEGNATTYTSIQQAVLADACSLNPALTAADVTVTTGTQNGYPVTTVTVSYTFRTITNFPGVPAITLSSTSATARVAPAAPN